MRRALLLFTAGHSDLQLLDGDHRYELDKDHASALHEALARRSDWTLADSKPKRHDATAAPRKTLPDAAFQLCTPKLDEILRYLDTQNLALAHALLLHTDRPAQRKEPTQAGPILQRRLHERGHTSTTLVSYLSAAGETLEDTGTAGDEVLRRQVVARLDRALAEALAHPAGPFDVVVIAAIGGFPQVQQIIEELARLRAGPATCHSLDVADAKRDLPERAVVRSAKTDPAALAAATRHALALVERGDFIAAWGAVAHLEQTGRITPAFRWLYEWAASIPHLAGHEPPPSFPLPRPDQRALATALRVELALRRGDIARAIHGTYAFYEAAIWDFIYRDHVRSTHALPDGRLVFQLAPEPVLPDLEDGFEPASSVPERGSGRQTGEPGFFAIKNFGKGCKVIRKHYLAPHAAEPAATVALKALGEAVTQIELLRNLVAHSEPSRERLASAQEQMRQKKLWSRKQRPSVLTQPLFLDVLAALGISSLEQALASLLADVRARALASWGQP